ncbi:MAG: MmgE/PrpD family protein [Dehalococcoidales bacterium]|nr:MmgE/PrpD family protein [Dehalococcoidales bacterium]
MQSLSLSRSLAEYVEGLSYKDLPQDVIERAKTSILNVFAGSFAGWDLPWPRIAMKAGENYPGKSTVWAYGNKTNPAEAAMANATMAHSVMIEDFALGLGHPGDSVVPPAIAVAEEKELPGAELIVAIVLGYDVIGRVGVRFGNKLHSGFGESSVLGNFGSVTSASRLLKLNTDQICNALGYAATFSSGTLEHWIYGSMEGMFQMGVAARNGVFLAKLAQMGATAAETALDGHFGFYQAFTGEPGGSRQAETSSSPGKYCIMQALVKLYPSCGANQVTLDLGLFLNEQYHFKSKDIEKIIQKVSPQFMSGSGNNFSGPFKNQFQAQMSTQFCLAAALIGKPVKSTRLYTHDYNDTEILEVARRVELIPEEGRTWLNPGIEVILKNGERYLADDNRLARFIPDWETAVKSFTSNAGGVLGEDRASQVVEIVSNLEKLDNVARLTALLSR